MIIDANMYYIPEELFEDRKLLERFLTEVPERDGWYADCRRTDDGGRKQIILEKPKGYQNLNYVQYDYILGNQLADMDRAGVERAVLKVPCCQEWMSLDMCRFFNDRMAEHAERSRGRLEALAVIPPYGTEENLEELERCIGELHMKGIQVSAHYGDAYLDDMRFASFFEKINELEMTVYVHHTPVPVEYGSFYEYNNLRRSYGRSVDQGLAVSRELFGGFFERYPKIRMVHSQLGGGFFAMAGLMFPGRAKQEAVSRFQTANEKVLKQLRKNVYFEMSHAQPWGKAQLECAVKVLGADRILFGTSYPVRKEWLLEGPAFVRSLDISEGEKEQILGKNAAELYF